MCIFGIFYYKEERNSNIPKCNKNCAYLREIWVFLTGKKYGLLHLAKIYIWSLLSFHNKTFPPSSKNGFIQPDLKKEIHILEKFVKMEIIFFHPSLNIWELLRNEKKNSHIKVQKNMHI